MGAEARGLHPAGAADAGDRDVLAAAHALSACAAAGPATQAIVAATLEIWPEHVKLLRKSFAAEFAAHAPVREAAADLLLKLTRAEGDALTAWAYDYRYMCERILMPEELHFRRHGAYRLSTFAEAEAEVYANAPLMARYMRGLLVSDVLWSNHGAALDHYVNRYLADAAPGGAHLEIGPGHGLLLHLALRSGKFSSLAGWDVSETSIAHTREALALYGEADRVRLRRHDVLDPREIGEHAGQYSSIVLSEVLEHLENPARALRLIAGLLAPGGKLWINVPANCPAPDHLVLLRGAEEVAAMVRQAGLEIVDEAAFPSTGTTLDKAIRNDLTVSYVVVATART